MRSGRQGENARCRRSRNTRPRRRRLSCRRRRSRCASQWLLYAPRSLLLWAVTPRCSRVTVGDTDGVQGSETEYTSASSDEEGRMAKPVFVTKQARETIAEREKLALEEMAAKEEAKKRASARVVRLRGYV